MTDIAPAPLREQTPSAGQNSTAVVPSEGNQTPVSPAVILSQQKQSAPVGNNRRKLMLWGGAGLLALQVLGPPALKPTLVAGEAAAGFYGQIMAASSEKEEKLARRRLLMERHADLEARYSEAMAKCGFAQLIGPEAYQLCSGAVGQNFVPAMNQIRSQLQSL